MIEQADKKTRWRAHDGRGDAAVDFARTPEGSPPASPASAAPSFTAEDDEDADADADAAAEFERGRAANRTAHVLGSCSSGLYTDAARRAALRRRAYRREKGALRAESAELELRELERKRRALAAPGPFEGLMRREREQADRRQARAAEKRDAERTAARTAHFTYVPPPHLTAAAPPPVSTRARDADRIVANKVRAAHRLAYADVNAPRCAKVTTRAADASAPSCASSQPRRTRALASAEVPKRSGRQRSRKTKTVEWPASSSADTIFTCVPLTGCDAPRYTATLAATRAATALMLLLRGSLAVSTVSASKR